MKIIENQDKEYAKKVKKALLNNFGYCPCSVQKSEDTKCKCKAFREQVANKEEGFCHCQLYQVVKGVY